MTYDLHQLRAFITVALTGSVGRAAERLNVSQPAVSRMIRKLEDQVGEHLFERHPGGMRLTSIGEALLPHAQSIRQGEEAAREEIEARRGLASGSLRIGAVASTSAVVLPRLLERFASSWPGLSIEVIEGVWEQLEVALTTYSVDIVLATEAPESDDVVKIRGCGWSERVDVVAAAGHSIHERRVELGDLVDEQWAFLPKGTEPHSRWSRAFIDAGLASPKVSISTTSIPMIKTLVSNGRYVSWLTAPMYESERAAGVLLPVVVSGLSQERKIRVYCRRVGRMSGPAVRFVEALGAVDGRLEARI